MRFILAPLIICLAITSASAEESPVWASDLQAAQALAAESNKDVLINFTGSDWCPPCIRLKDQVLGQEAFISGAQEHFVLVELDFPRNTELPESQAAANAQAQEQYEISGYPTIVLADAEGRPYAQSGFRDIGPEEYLAHLKELTEHRAQRDNDLAAAKELEGLERGKALNAALERLKQQNVSLRWYQEEIEHIIAADPENEAGLSGTYRDQLVLWQLNEELVAVHQAMQESGEQPDIEGLLERYGHVDEARQQIVLTQAGMAMEGGDLERTIELLKKAQKIAPESETGTYIGQIINHLQQQQP